METVIIINPDRFSRQSFPPFVFLCKALLEANFKVKCLGAKRHSSLPEVDFYSPFKTNSKPLLYGVSFVIFSFIKVLKFTFNQRSKVLVVFRSCDSLTHFLSSRILGFKIVFFVDYLPWNKGNTVIQILKNPQTFLQILGLCSCDKLVISSNYLAEEIVKNLPFLVKKIVVERYSPEVYSNQSSEELRNNIINRFNIVDPVLIFSGASCAELSVRALAKFKNVILILQVNDLDSKYFISLAQALGLIDRIEFVSPDNDVLELIAEMDLVITPGSGRYILTAIAQEIPVLAPSLDEMREWIRSERFLFKPDSVESLRQSVSRSLSDKKWRKDGIAECKAHFESFKESWGQRAVEQLSSCK